LKPFLKWAGNKYRIIEKIQAVLPQAKRLIEPFAGSAAVFLNSDYSRYLLGEGNKDLINLYQILQLEGEVFIDYVQTFFAPEFKNEKKYYELRQLFNSTDDQRLKAALFLYLNKCGYNGLCRYNSKGGFNVPYGHYERHKLPPYFPREEMQYFYKKAKRAKFIHADFVATMQQAKSGDVVYCDPPYLPLSETANFTDYHVGGFSEQQHITLAEQAGILAKRGITTVISNHDTDFVRQYYQSAELHRFQVQRMISCQGAARAKAPEILAIFHA